MTPTSKIHHHKAQIGKWVIPERCKTDAAQFMAMIAVDSLLLRWSVEQRRERKIRKTGGAA